MAKPHFLFVTGKLAEPALRRILHDLAPQVGFDFSVAVLKITVAALMSTPWVARHLSVPEGVDRVVLPGLCTGDLSMLSPLTSAPVERGPQELLDLPEFFQAAGDPRPGYGAYDITILAEINHAPRLPFAELLPRSRAARASGADVVDLVCNPGETWAGVADAVRGLRDEGMRVALDSFNPLEVEAAATAGAELILSINSSNRDAARSWGCEVVAVPDVPATLEGLDETVAALQAAGVPFRIDPVIEPIGFGFAASLGRYLEVRRRYPAAEMLMGVDNLTESTDVDSAGVNLLLAGFCQEVGIRSVVTTEVSNWCRSSVRELNLARRLVYYACSRRVLPKHLEPDLVQLRDPKLREYGEDRLRELAAQLKDPNIRIFAEGGLVHVFNSRMFLQGTDPFDLFPQMLAARDIHPAHAFNVPGVGRVAAKVAVPSKEMGLFHAFYLGYEMAKAVTALTLGKKYAQDQALHWGSLTVPEEPKGGPAAPPS